MSESEITALERVTHERVTHERDEWQKEAQTAFELYNERRHERDQARYLCIAFALKLKETDAPAAWCMSEGIPWLREAVFAPGERP